MLSVQDGPGRTEHRTWLAPWGTLVMYTDGLVERRGEDVDTGLERLCRFLGAVLTEVEPESPAEDRGGVGHLADTLLAELLPAGGEDDVAVVLVRPRP